MHAGAEPSAAHFFCNRVQELVLGSPEKFYQDLSGNVAA
jgi:hypothetical protein